MRIQGAKKIHYDSGPNMTPLVDVVMVILIFLMLTGSFGAAAHFLPSNAPIRSGGKGQIDPNEVPKIPDPQLDIYIATIDDGTYKARVGSGEEFFNGVSRAGKKLVDSLRELKAKQESPDKLQVVLAPRLSTRYKHIIEVYQVCMEAECPKIGFQTARD
jgi:biopolymer transport protein ExbD